MSRRFLCLLAALLLALGLDVDARTLPKGVTAVTAVEGIEEYRFANGLQLLLVPDDSKPTTTVNMTVRVGSRFENYGETGMAHLLEHMMFKGTPKHPKVWAEFEKRGLAANGSTSFDRTTYTATFSADERHLAWMVDWLADALIHSSIARKDLDTEMTVVRNEMEMGETSPERALYKRALAVMYDWHNYGKDTIGARTDVEEVDIPQLRAFYRLYYQPDNTTLVVSGRFAPDALLAGVARSFGSIAKPRRRLPVFYTLDPAQDGERSVTVRRAGGAPVVFAGYHVPAAADPDFCAIELLTLVMGDRPSGRLHRRLTQTQLAAGTFAFAQGMAEPGYAVFGAQLAPGQDLDRAREALLATLETIDTPLTQDELERAKTQWLNDWEHTFASPESVSQALSESIAQGDWRLFFLQRDRVRAVALADLQRAAARWLLRSNRTLATYVPSDNAARAPLPVKVDVAAQLKDFRPQAGGEGVEAFEATPANIDRRTQRFNVGGVRVALLPKGTRGQAVRATLTLHFGTEKTLAGLGDVPDFTAAMLDKGTATMNRQQLQDRLDALKTEISIGAGAGSVSVDIVSRRESLPAAIALVAQMLREPSLPASALDELRRETLAGIEQERRQPEAMAGNALARLDNPYPPGDIRYARSFDEMVAGVGAVTLEQVLAFHRRFYGAKLGEFAAVGDFDGAAVRRALEAGFGDWNAGEDFARVPQPLVPAKPEHMELRAPDNQNATLLVSLAVPLSDGDADYPALMMANYLLGNGGNSRLWKRIREGDGLSYDVKSRIGWNNEEPNSEWQASVTFAPQNRARVEAAFKAEVDRALKEGFTEQELAEGRQGLLNFRRLSRSQDRTIASSLANNLYLGRSFAVSAQVDAALARLTLQQVNQALRQYVKPAQWSSAVAGDFAP
jgi:zinc protease